MQKEILRIRRIEIQRVTKKFQKICHILTFHLLYMERDIDGDLFLYEISVPFEFTKPS